MTALEVFLYVLAALNVLAFGYWLRSMQFRVVVQDTTQLRSWARRLPRPGLPAIRPAWNDAVRRVKSWWPPAGPGVTAETAGLADGMESWIEEVEKAETPTAAPESGSEDWWRSWADSGGLLPRAAESGRRDLHETPTW